MDKDDWKTNIRLGKTIWPLCAKRFPKVKRTLLFFKDPPTSTLGFGSRLWEPILTPAKALRARPRSRLQRPSRGAAERDFYPTPRQSIFLSGTFISGIEKRFPKQETKQMLSLWNPARKIDYFVGVWSGKAKQMVFLRRIWTKTTGK